MRIKKSSIIEAASNPPINTSNTTSKQTNNTTNLPKPEDVNKSKEMIDDLNSEVDKINKDLENGPISAFLKVNEGKIRKVIKTIKVKDLK